MVEAELETSVEVQLHHPRNNTEEKMRMHLARL
jgi:hypothetical protein